MSSPKGTPLGLGSLWAAIRGSTGERADTAAVWGRIRDTLDQTGTTLPPNAFQLVNQYRSLATGLRNATQAFDRASGDQLISGQMLGQSPFSRSLDQQALVSEYHVQYQVTGTVGGQTYTQWLTDTVGSLTGLTKDQLLAQLYDSALLGTLTGSPPFDEVSSVDAVSIVAM